jgi:hypothetical protein
VRSPLPTVELAVQDLHVFVELLVLVRELLPYPF